MLFRSWEARLTGDLQRISEVVVLLRSAGLPKKVIDQVKADMLAESCRRALR